MPTYTIKLSRSAEKEFDRLDSSLQRRILKKLRGLEAAPRGPGSIKLSGDESWRVRIGDYRVVYEIHDDVLIVLVLRVGHRRDIYL